MSRGLSNEEITEVYENYRPLIRNSARRFFRDDTTADDILMEVLSRLLEKGSAYRRLQGLRRRRRWLKVVTYRVCVDWYRRRLPIKLDALEQHSCEPRALATVLEQRDVLRRLHQGLPREDRALAVLVFEEQHTKMEAHRRLGRSRPCVDHRLMGIARRCRRLTEG